MLTMINKIEEITLLTDIILLLHCITSIFITPFRKERIHWFTFVISSVRMIYIRVMHFQIHRLFTS